MRTLLKTEYVPAATQSDRIQAAELAIVDILKRFNCKLGISLINVEGKRVHQEIVVIDTKE